MLSWGGADSTNSGSAGIGYIRLNGNMGILARKTDRGFNIIELDINNCIATKKHTFDTNGDGNSQYSNDLAVYIQSLRPPTVIVGITVDDAAGLNSGTTAAAKNALFGIGVDVSTMSFQGKISFIAQIGRPSASIVKLAAAGGDNMKMNAAVSSMYKTDFSYNVALRDSIQQRYKAIATVLVVP
jgi:hypothetical protein